jgi:hypothetical protein
VQSTLVRHSLTPTSAAASATVSHGGQVARARLLQATPSVLLLEGPLPGGRELPIGSFLQVALPGQARTLEARLAAYGDGDRYLVSLGSRAVRGAVRMQVDLPAVARGPGLADEQPVRVVDLSSSGARLSGIRLPVGSDFELRFVPPGRRGSVAVRCVVVRAIDEGGPAEVGVTFSGGSLSFSVELRQRRMAGAR